MDKPSPSEQDQVPEDISYPQGMLVQHILARSAERFPNRPAVVVPVAAAGKLYETSMSYRDLDRAANRLANGLVALGIRRGDRVALILDNCPQFLIGYFGALRAGAIVVPLNPAHSGDELERQLIECGAETVLSSKAVYHTVKQRQPNTYLTRVIATSAQEYYHPLARTLLQLGGDKQQGGGMVDARDYSFRRILHDSPETPPEVAPDPEVVAQIQYTSGTTGAPRGAVLTHRNLVANAMQIAAWRSDVQPGREIVLCTLPFWHAQGLQLGLLSSVWMGGVLVLVQDVTTRGQIMAIEKYQPTVWPLFPQTLKSLLEYPAIGRRHLQSLRLCLTAGAPLPAALGEAAAALTGASIIETYGSAEAGGVALANPVRGANPPGSTGRPVASCQAQVVQPERQVPLAPGETGELRLRGPQVMSGYWKDAAGTEAVWRDGWLLTGDYASMNEDGFIRIVGRKQDRIDVGGFAVWPREVEEVLTGHPKVRDAAVVGIDDPHVGQVPKAFVVLKRGETASRAEVLTHLGRYLAEFQLPRSIEFRDSLPTGSAGQVLRGQLREEERTRSTEQAGKKATAVQAQPKPMS